MVWLATALLFAGLVTWAPLPAAASDYRAAILPSWSVAALAIAVLLARPWRWLRISVAVLGTMLIVGWLRAGGAASSTPHLGGASVGLLLMVLIGRMVTTRARLTMAISAFLLAGTFAIGTGMSGVPPGFDPGMESTLRNVVRGYPALNQALLAMGQRAVNPNALSGLVLLVAPVAASVLLIRRNSRLLLLVLKTFSAAVVVGCVAVLVTAFSRTGLLAASLLVLVVAIRASHRWVRVSALVATFAVPFAAAVWLRTAWVPYVASGVADLQSAMTDRWHVLRFAADRFQEDPWLGVGLNRFRDLYIPPAGVRGYDPAHAHNIFLQTGLDVGIIGLAAYVAILAMLLVAADRTARGPDSVARAAAVGGGLSLVGVHLFGIADAVALGARIGVFQWAAAGFVLAATQVQALHKATPPVPAERSDLAQRVE